MAKKVVGPIEQHVEKAVLAVAGIGLIGVIAMYLVTSPNQIEIGNQMVSPTTVDQVLFNRAGEVRQRINTSRAPDMEFEPLADAFVESLTPFEGQALAVEYAAGAMLGPDVPVIDPAINIAKVDTLVQVLRLDAPEVTCGRSTFLLPNGSYVPANWVTVSAVFDRDEQEELQSTAYGSQRKRVIFGPVDLQRRARRPDGGWSDEDWESVTAWPATEPPDPPEIPFIEEEGQVLVARLDLIAVDRFQEALEDPLLQLDLLRPLMPEIYNGTPWKYPKLVSKLDLLRMDDDYLNSTQVDLTPEAELENRYMLEEEEAAVAVAEEEEEEDLTPGEEAERRLAEGEALLDQARAGQSSETAVDAYNIFIEVKWNKDASQATRSKAERLATEADQLDKDIRRQIRDRGRSRVVAEDDVEEERQLQPRQQLWAHDARPGSVESGTAYQYRMRVNLFNRLIAEPSKFADPEMARVAFIPGEWSEPSDPIEIEPVETFFITGADPRKKTVKAEMYRWFDGVWVTTRGNFGVGDRLFSRTRVPVPDWEFEGGVDRPEVEFNPGATILNIDFNRPIRERKGRRGTVSFPQSMSGDCSVLLVNSAGELEERFVTADKDHPGKKALKDRVYQPAKKR